MDSPVTQAMDEFLNDDPKPRGKISHKKVEGNVGVQSELLNRDFLLIVMLYQETILI